MQAGDRALDAGNDPRPDPPQIALLAAIGRGTVRVRPRPRVVVMSTGSELVQPDEELAGGQIYDSNSFALTAAARDAGAIAYRVGAVADDAETLRTAIEDQLVRADLMVTTGGVSVGAYDVVKEALAHVADEDEPGSGVEFRKLAMQPGKPQGFGSSSAPTTPRSSPCPATRSRRTSPSSSSSAPRSAPSWGSTPRRAPAHHPRHPDRGQAADLAEGPQTVPARPVRRRHR
ncbi:hypothetical protein SGLAM104S_04414 [Streptomyces glaucescens]